MTKESGIDLAFDALKEDGLTYIPTENESKQFYQLRSQPVSGSQPTGIVPTAISSRTQLKQVLARQQQYDEEHRIQPSSSSSDVSVSLHIPTKSVQGDKETLQSNLPPQVLKVKKILSNPTRFHVQQQQQHQVNHFIGDDQHGLQVINSLPNFANISNTAVRCTPALPHPSSLPAIIESQPAEIEIDDVQQRGGVLDDIISLETADFSQDPDLSAIDPEISAALYSSMTNCSYNAPSDYAQNVSIKPPSTPRLSHSAPSKPYRGGRQREDPPAAFTSRQERDNWLKERERKDNHNIIEKRRRYYINDCIIELGQILPKELFSNIVPGKEDSNKHKGTILGATVKYVKETQQKTNLGVQQQQLARKAIDMNKEIILRCAELEKLLMDNGIGVPRGCQTHYFSQLYMENKTCLDKLEQPTSRSRKTSQQAPAIQLSAPTNTSFLQSMDTTSGELMAFHDDESSSVILGSDVQLSQPMDTDAGPTDFYNLDTSQFYAYTAN